MWRPAILILSAVLLFGCQKQPAPAVVAPPAESAPVAAPVATPAPVAPVAPIVVKAHKTRVVKSSKVVCSKAERAAYVAASDNAIKAQVLLSNAARLGYEYGPFNYTVPVIRC